VTVQTPPSTPIAGSRPWSIALSGGGHRAALFSLGALMYLVDAGVNRQVSSIASVSGGSLANGVVAKEVDFDSTTPSEFTTAITPLIGMCANSGTVQWAAATKRWIAKLMLALAVSIASILYLATDWRLIHWKPPVAVPIVGLIAGVGWMLYLIARRSAVAEKVFDTLLFKGAGLNGMHTSVEHVICATEIQSAEHCYLTPAYGYSYYFKQTQGAPNMSVARAVQASACFPPAFPPRRIAAHRIGFAPSSERRSLLLTDGGVYDNMGDEWAIGHARRAIAGSRVAPQRLLVVNASAHGGFRRAGFLSTIPLIGELVALKGESDVMFGQTTAGRRSSLVAQFDLARQVQAAGGPEAGAPAPPMGGNLAHIATPADWPLHGTVPPPGVDCARYGAARQNLIDLGDTELENLRRARTAASEVPTVLSGVGAEKAADLLWHGYMLTMVNFHVFEGQPWLPRDRRDFLVLAGS
jgi:predicted acylesterase/phospholipase RssA